MHKTDNFKSLVLRKIGIFKSPFLHKIDIFYHSQKAGSQTSHHTRENMNP